MLGLARGSLDARSASAAIAARRPDFVAALVAEAADNDDVTSAEAALEYLDGRLRFFGDLVGGADGEAIRASFVSATAAWG
jgi:hypothetical protein